MLCFRHRGGTGFGTGIFLSLIGVLVYLIVTMFRKIRRLRLLNRRHMRFYQAEILELNLVGVLPELRQRWSVWSAKCCSPCGCGAGTSGKP